MPRSCHGRGLTRSARHRRLRHRPRGSGRSCPPNLRTQCPKPALRPRASHGHCQRRQQMPQQPPAPAMLPPPSGPQSLCGITATVGAANVKTTHSRRRGRSHPPWPAHASPAASWAVRRAARFGRRFVVFARRCWQWRPARRTVIDIVPPGLLTIPRGGGVGGCRRQETGQCGSRPSRATFPRIVARIRLQRASRDWHRQFRRAFNQLGRAQSPGAGLAGAAWRCSLRVCRHARRWNSWSPTSRRAAEVIVGRGQDYLFPGVSTPGIVRRLWKSRCAASSTLQPGKVDDVSGLQQVAASSHFARGVSRSPWRISKTSSGFCLWSCFGKAIGHDFN